MDARISSLSDERTIALKPRRSIVEDVVDRRRICALERGLGAQAQQRSSEMVGNTPHREVRDAFAMLGCLVPKMEILPLGSFLVFPVCLLVAWLLCGISFASCSRTSVMRYLAHYIILHIKISQRITAYKFIFSESRWPLERSPLPTHYQKIRTVRLEVV